MQQADTSISLKSTLRAVAKAGCAAGLHWSAMDRLIGARRGLRSAPLVVGYHRVVEDFAHSSALTMPSMLVSTKTFAQQLEWIGKRYDFVTLDELALVLEGERHTARPVAAITFDDGYRDVYLNALPVLRRMGIPSAMYVVTDLTGSRALLQHDELYLLLSALMKEENPREGWWAFVEDLDLPAWETALLKSRIGDSRNPLNVMRAMLETLDRPAVAAVMQGLRQRISIPDSVLEEFRLLDWNMLKEMARHGVTIGSHSRSHALLAHEDVPVVAEELRGSREELERHLGMEIRHFAYPDGRFNEVALRAAAEAGYRTACTICGHQDRHNPLLTISRRMLWEKSCTDAFGRFSPAVLSCQVNGIFDPADRCQLQHWN